MIIHSILASGFLMSVLLGGFVTLLCNILFYTYQSKKQKLNSIHAASTVIGFFMALQISELSLLEKAITERLDKIKALRLGEKVDVTQITADFACSSKISINMEEIAAKILAAYDRKERKKYKEEKDITKILQCIFNSDRNYFKILNGLNRFNGIKRLAQDDLKKGIIKDEHALLDILIHFLEREVSGYRIQIIETLLPYQKATFKNFKEEIQKQFRLRVLAI
ncbi:MAG: hypothetical protein K0R48_418 [Gammaproteobacteria bacterium]|nr:hypothetical protein [Gammaproteobacteria bacterium]